MKKLFIIVTTIFIGILVFLGIKFIPILFDETILIINNYKDEGSTSGNFAFKQTPVDPELLNSYYLVNNSFIKDYSKELDIKNTISNSYIMIDYFSNFKLYYATKLKLEKAIFEALPYLCDKAINLSNEELKTFFYDNLEYLDSTLGITTLDQFSSIVTNLSYLENKSINYAEIANSNIQYNKYGDNILFSIYAKNTENDFVTFNVRVYSKEYESKTQKTPVVIFDALGGIS